ncbi:hypothetical protein BGZ79_008461 [Entomortierella chlamydospora]|nr:hypothetical protein BGZ79_008461 [Entomortierella chlamydospora]
MGMKSRDYRTDYVIDGAFDNEGFRQDLGKRNSVKFMISESNYAPDGRRIDDAALFKVEYKGNNKLVTNSAAGVSTIYILTQCGAPPPDVLLFDNTVFVNVPVMNAVSTVTTTVTFIEMLSKRSALKAAYTETLASSPCVQYDLEHHSVMPPENTNRALRAEQFQSVDVIFNSFGAEPDTENKTIIISEVSYRGALNRAGWLKFYSAFFDLEGFAQNLTAVNINNNYNRFKGAVASSAAYKKILSTDAGATFYNGITVSTFSNSADFQATLKNVVDPPDLDQRQLHCHRLKLAYS